MGAKAEITPAKGWRDHVGRGWAGACLACRPLAPVASFTPSRTGKSTTAHSPDPGEEGGRTHGEPSTGNSNFGYQIVSDILPLKGHGRIQGWVGRRAQGAPRAWRVSERLGGRVGERSGGRLGERQSTSSGARTRRPLY